MAGETLLLAEGPASPDKRALRRFRTLRCSGVQSGSAIVSNWLAITRQGRANSSSSCLGAAMSGQAHGHARLGAVVLGVLLSVFRDTTDTLHRENLGPASQPADKPYHQQSRCVPGALLALANGLDRSERHVAH